MIAWVFAITHQHSHKVKYFALVDALVVLVLISPSTCMYGDRLPDPAIFFDAVHSRLYVNAQGEYNNVMRDGFLFSWLWLPSQVQYKGVTRRLRLPVAVACHKYSTRG